MKLGRQSFAGSAHLESGEILFRGETRLKIPLATVRDVAVKGGALHITHADGLAVFGLGDAMATKWAEKIRNPRSLADKLGVKAGMVVANLGVEDPAVLSDIAAKGATITAGTVPRESPMVLWRITKPASLSKLAAIAQSIATDGCIWVVHPRGDASVADVVIFAAAKDAGLTYTKVVRFSETDTAEKLVIPKAARKKV